MPPASATIERQLRSNGRRWLPEEASVQLACSVELFRREKAGQRIRSEPALAGPIPLRSNYASNLSSRSSNLPSQRCLGATPTCLRERLTALGVGFGAAVVLGLDRRARVDDSLSDDSRSDGSRSDGHPEIDEPRGQRDHPKRRAIRPGPDRGCPAPAVELV